MSELILLFYLKNGGKIEIKFCQDRVITEQAMLTDYAGENNSFIEYVKRLLVNGNGILKKFDKNSRLIKEKKYDHAQGMITVYLNASGQTQENNMVYTFNGEGVYKLTFDSNTELETIEILTKINSPY
ncbi:MAG: hypothetical protein LBQ74_01705 [Prevotella sp.]|jgi:hypothetical protein|nr:hypothetical protein [Prevotella sp.]